MNASTPLIIYASGFVVVLVGTWLSLGSEPTAHGQIVGRQFGCLLAVFWPLALAYGVGFGIGFAGFKAWQGAKALVAKVRS